MWTHVFAYGTLQLPEVMTAVTGRRFEGVPAHLPGYVRYALRRRRYPGVRPRRGHETDGVLYRNVDPRALARLDAFEDRFYRRRRLLVAVAGEHRVPAEVYTVDPSCYRLFEQRAWSLAAFRKRCLKTYLRRCRRGFAADSGGAALGGRRKPGAAEVEVAWTGQSR
ncbi:MAG: gamma-glutamylcyclotransferase [Gammaproteobacteria bacterium]|nr:gamma-glutamylcyclotransferase [Gammaproteobacteria bacterium]